MKRCCSCDGRIDAGLLVCQECSQKNSKLKAQIRRMAEFIIQSDIEIDESICKHIYASKVKYVDCEDDENCITCIIKHFESEVQNDT